VLPLTPRQDEFFALLRDRRLSDKRMAHVLGVAETIVRIARRERLNMEKAVAAALLHDACREYDNETMLGRAAAFGISISPAQQEKPMLLHGPVAAEEGKHHLGIDDPEIYEAVYWHTTGKPDMGPIARALYLADYAEPGRTHADAATAWSIYENDGLAAALRFVAENKAAHAARKRVSDPASQRYADSLRGGAA